MYTANVRRKNKLTKGKKDLLIIIEAKYFWNKYRINFIVCSLHCISIKNVKRKRKATRQESLVRSGELAGSLLSLGFLELPLRASRECPPPGAQGPEC